MNEFIVIGIGGVIAVLIALFFVKKMIIFLINSVIGLFALMGWNYLFSPVVINVWSVLAVALFGIVGLVGVVGLHFLGVLF